MSDLQPPDRIPLERATWRASDADREQTARRLRDATREGRLLADELEQRLDAALSARTYGELDALVGDLPMACGPKPRQRRAELIPVPRTATIALAVAALLALLLIAAAAGIGFGRSSAAAPNQPHPGIRLNAAGQ